MSNCSGEAETISKLNIAEEDFLCHDTDGESIEDYYSQNIVQDELPFKQKENYSKNTNDQIADEKVTRIVSNHSTNCEKIEEGRVSTHKTTGLPSKKTVRFKSVSFIDCEDINKELTKIIPEGHEKKVNVNDGITDHTFTEININRPPEGGRIQEDKPVEVISHDGYKTNEQPFEDMPSYTVAVEHLPFQIKHVEGLVLNNDRHVKKTFEETVNRFKKALQSSIEVENKDIPTLISKDKTYKRISIKADDNYYNTTQDNIKDQRDKEVESKVSSVVASNADDEVVLCPVDDKNINYGKDSPGQEKMSAIDVSANVAELTTALSELSDEEEFTKTSKQFTFSDSDLPDSDEETEILMSYPRPTFIEPFSELEVEDSSQEEIYRFLRRRRNKTAIATMVDIMTLPERFITRLRKPIERLGISTEVKNDVHLLKSRYIIEQEDDMDVDIIIETVKRLKSFERQAKSLSRKENNNKMNEHKKTIEVKIKDERKNAKSKSTSSGRKLVALGKNKKKRHRKKEDAGKAGADLKATSGSRSTAETITRRTRSMKNDKDNKCKLQENKIKPESKKKRPTSPEKVRRSKRQQATKPILKKSTHVQSTVYSSSSSESSKSLKRSLVDDSDVPSPKRTRSHNTTSNSSIHNTSLRATPATVKTQRVLAALPSAVKQDTQGPFVRLERMQLPTNSFKTQKNKRNSLKGHTMTRSHTTRPRRTRR